MYAFVSSPYIATTWTGPSSAQSFLDGAGWRWGYGTFAIVTPVMCMPFLIIYFYNIRKANNVGLRKTKEQKRTFLQAVWYWFIEFDGKLWNYAHGDTLICVQCSVWFWS